MAAEATIRPEKTVVVYVTLGRGAFAFDNYERFVFRGLDQQLGTTNIVTQVNTGQDKNVYLYNVAFERAPQEFTFKKRHAGAVNLFLPCERDRAFPIFERPEIGRAHV